MKLLSRISFLFAALFAASLPALADLSVSFTPPTSVDAATGAAISATVNGGEAAYVYAEVTQGNNTFLVFLSGSGSSWSGTLPPAKAGTASVRIVAEPAEGEPASTVAQPVTYVEAGTAATALTNQRYPNLPNWPMSQPSDGVLDADWTGINLERPVVTPQAVRLVGSPVTNTPGFSGAGAGGNLRTTVPVADGVGTLWLKARMANTNRVAGGTLSIERITWISGTGNRARYRTTELAEIEVPAATAYDEWHQYHLVLQSDNPSAAQTDQGYYRIRNKTIAESSGTIDCANASVEVCDIVLGPLLPDVRVYKDELDYAPGYPSILDPVAFHIAVSNRFDAAPAGNLSPRLVWRQNARDAWRTTEMTNVLGRDVQAPGTYACVLSADAADDAHRISDGEFEYFYEVGFSGYSPTFPARKNKGPLFGNVINRRFNRGDVKYLIHTNDWAMMTDADEQVNEGRAPATYPDFEAQYARTDVAEAGLYGDFAYNWDVAPNSAATNSVWDFTPFFDIHHLNAGWPSKTVYYQSFDEIGAVTVASTLEVPATFRMLEPQAPIRRFRSMYTDMTAELRVYDTNSPGFVASAEPPPGMRSSYPMQLVGDYTWQAILHETNAIDAVVAVQGALHYEDGMTRYERGNGEETYDAPFLWLELDQEPTAINPPMSGADMTALGEGDHSLHRYGTDRIVRYREFVADEDYEGNEYTDPARVSVTNGRPLAVDANTLYVAVATNDMVYVVERLKTTTRSGVTTTNAVPLYYNWMRQIGDPTVYDRVYLVDMRNDIEFATAYLDGPRTTNTLTGLRGTYPALVRFAERMEVPFATDEPLAVEGGEEVPISRLGSRMAIDYKGNLMLRFSTKTGEYQIRRAAWQDFNAWQADDKAFSQSVGLDGTKTFSADAEALAVTTMRETEFTKLEGGNAIDPTSDMQEEVFWNGTVAKNAWCIEERTERQAVAGADPKVPVRNHAYRLSTMPGIEGSVETTGTEEGTRGDGRGVFGFRVRSSSDDDRFAIWKEWTGTDAQILVEAAVVELAPGDASISLIARYQNPQNYVEGRITQLSAPIYKNSRVAEYFDLKLELIAVVNGERRVLATKYWKSNNATTNQNNWETGADYKLNGTKKWYYLKVEGSTATFSVYHNASSALPASPTRTVTGTIPLALSSGMLGMNTRECDVNLNFFPFGPNETARPKSASSVQGLSGASNDRGEGWLLGEEREAYGYVSPWALTAGGSSAANPSTLHRPAPSVYYRVETFRTGKTMSESLRAPVPTATASWATDWDDYGEHANDQIKEVKSYQWLRTPVSVPMHFWDDTYIRIHALAEKDASNASAGLLMVDDLTCTEWRGLTLYDPEFADEETSARDALRLTDSWKATFAVVRNKADRTGKCYELDRTRTNYGTEATAYAQSIVTPLLLDGIGDLWFRYQAKTHPVSFVVQKGDATGTSWEDLASFTAEPTDDDTDWTPRYVPCLRRESGRLRILTKPYPATGAQQLGTLLVDDLRATDYPNDGNSSWEAYNVQVSSFPADMQVRAPANWPAQKANYVREKFDGGSTAAASYRSAVLNDSPTDNTYNQYVFDGSSPYVQTPSIETGVGEVSFWYRSSPDNGDEPARLRLLVSTSPSPNEADWKELTVADLNTNAVDYIAQSNALERLQAIPKGDWTYFSAEFYQQEYKLLRFYSGTNDVPNRVMIDNVLITEPVRSSIDVGPIEFDPGVPLCTKDTAVKIRLVNPRMNPHDIRVYLDWYAMAEEPVDTLVSNTYDVVRVQQIPHNDNALLPDGRLVPVTWYETVTNTTTYGSIDATRLPPSLSRRWGYANWQHPTGTIAFTNNPAVDPYQYYSVAEIPTSDWPADTVFQYCVRVEYEGTFAQPVYSETQGRVNNGFWFENPSWYEPIDLNEAYGTTNQPVAYFWNFTITTNCVFINEVYPVVYGVKDMTTDDLVRFLRAQFIELIGPEGGDISDWKMRHLAIVNGFLDSDVFSHTNVMEKGARFQPPYDGNAHTNKGWGFYVLGNSGVDVRDQALFPEERELTQRYGDYLEPLAGAVELRRSMGANVDRAVWGQPGDVAHITEKGFTFLGYRRVSANTSFALEGDASSDEGGLVWRTAGALTVGGYNSLEEDNLWWLDGTTEEKTPAPELEGLRITDIRLVTDETSGEESVVLRFAFTPSNGVDVTENNVEWYVVSSPELFTDVNDGDGGVRIVTPITARAGEETEVEVTLQRRSGDARFYRIFAITKETK